MEQKTSYADKLVDIRSVSVNKELPREERIAELPSSSDRSRTPVISGVESLLCVLLIVRTELH